MKVLHNTISNKILRNRMLVETERRTTISFYKYFYIDDPNSFRDTIYRKLNDLHVLGRIYIATEGINGQISVRKNNFNSFRTILYNSHPKLDKVRLNIALDNNVLSFWVLRIKVRASIVADGITDHSFNYLNVGHYLKAEEVNIMADNPDVLFVDMRNHYEYEIGHFKQALDIPSNTFREQLYMVVKMLQHDKNRHIVMYCTGGIRCEKASAWMLHNGFKNIYHVEGGIIGYTNRAKELGLPIKFIGKNFVFDERFGERITSEVIAHCHQCNSLCDSYTNCRNTHCHRLFIQCNNCAKKYYGCCNLLCKNKQLATTSYSV
ncbi:Rhodanese-related sulfurtransferase [Candidatus Palibaumannia cicadellinicola]|uniref:tRNA uridine(34) hydroxylase n=1 Tax=Candidatus Palibaumannia cicadellinicola TaxID=186490 RepID=A0A0K2BLR6_9GAMM|nr:Rhodanese-related sulfurtransferase [Candidatus Baumannia cicadellinicola]